MLKHDLEVIDLGLVDYSEALSFQEERVALRSENKVSDSLIFCSHPLIVTLGRGTLDSDISEWRGETCEVSRGGRATLHGPHQLIGYPVVSLQEELEIPSKDIHSYLKFLEDVLIQSLKAFGVEAHSKSQKTGELSYTGVWVGEQKLASIGVAIRKWITYHGFALNMTKCREMKGSFMPCGFTPNVMTSLDELGFGGLHQKELMSTIEKEFQSLYQG